MVTVVLGAQWGDEGKGKIVDYLSADADVIARYQGGANAGHTVVHDGRKFVLHLLPAGVLWPQTVNVIGAGVVVDPVALINEIEQVESAGISLENRLFVSHQAHLIMPYHKLLDQLSEAQSDRPRIGTTGRGIGPAYVDKAARVGIRIVDLLDRDYVREKIRKAVEDKNRLISRVYDAKQLDVDAIVEEYIAFDKKIDPYVKDVSVLLQEAVTAGKKIILEGAQGTLLDIDMGTYPYVTSSNPTAGGACTGLGIGPRRIDRVTGIIKAYTTRVGEGPFPTELNAEEGGQNLREKGEEYGATTGRPRRCGWFDGVVAKFSARVNSVDSWALTKLDVLTGIHPLRFCVAYEDGARTYRHFPSDSRILSDVRPVYEELSGWDQPLDKASRWSDLPAAAQKYLEFIQDFTGVPVSMISVGPSRHQTIVL
ncbi:adenylosuccinate synthase [candidate division KSB1 bacterium]|nr:MAG: adenylosuccinate synthase [candidate division KSB1 bacterium]